MHEQYMSPIPCQYVKILTVKIDLKQTRKLSTPCISFVKGIVFEHLLNQLVATTHELG